MAVAKPTPDNNSAAGGKGTRLAPYTVAFPKPLMPLGDTPILEIVIRQLKHYGFTHLTMAVGHLSEVGAADEELALQR